MCCAIDCGVCGWMRGGETICIFICQIFPFFGGEKEEEVWPRFSCE